MATTYTTRFAFVCLVVFLSSHAMAQYQGPSPPGLVTEEAFGCLACPGADWTNLNDASFADNLFASVPLTTYGNCFQTSCFYARALKAENFSFSIPSNAQIRGIVAEVSRKASTVNAVQDSLTQLLYYGFPIGTSRADTSYWGLNPSIMLYGDSMDLWGSSLLPSQVNSSTFGFFLKPRNKDLVSLFTTASIDYVNLTVYYQLPSGVFEHQSSAALPIFYLEENQQALVIKKGSASHDVIRIYNAVGTKVFEQDTRSPVLVIHTDPFSRGMYLVTIQSGMKFYSKKILLTGLR